MAVSSPRRIYEPDENRTPFERYQAAAAGGIQKARAELAASQERIPTFEREDSDVV